MVDGVFGADHPDLAPNIVAFEEIDESKAAESISPDNQRAAAIKEQFRAELTAAVEEDHGTLVAGVIAATRNGEGTQGVAPEAKIVAVDVEALDVFPLVDIVDSPDELGEAREIIEAEVDETIELFDGLDEEERQELLDFLEISDREEFVDTTFTGVFLEVIGFSNFVADDSESGRSEFIDFGSDGFVDREEGEKLFDLLEKDSVEIYGSASDIDKGLLSEGIDFAVSQGSQIINLSAALTDKEWSEQVQKALFSATEAGSIIVLSGGNEDRVDEDDEPLEEIPETDLSSQIVVDERTNGLALAVGVVDEDNEIQFNNCGPAKERCLVAPGIDITSTTKGGGTDTVDGSSFSAPAVSGSLALLLDLFPTISSEDAVEILLSSATDLGEEGVDEVYGHGLVNIERAVQPIGVASLPLGDDVSGRVVTLASSKIGLSGAFGDALRNIGALKNGLFLDKFRRPFAADLRGRVITDRRGIDFTGALSSSDIKTEHVTSGAFTTSLSLKRDVDEDPFFRPSSKAGLVGAFEEDQGDLQALSFSGEIVDGVTMRAGHNLTAGQQLAVDPVSGPASNLFLFTEDSTNPQHGFLGKGSGVSVTHQLTDQTQFSLGMMSAEGEGDSDREAGFTTQADLRHSFANESKIGLSFSFTGEGSGFLGSEIGGAFADQAETNSQFLTLSGSTPLTASIDLLGSASMGRSDLSGVNGGIVDNIDNVMTSAFMVGVAKNGLFDDKDKLGLMVSQPLRVESGGKASFDVPTSVNADGSIETTRTEASLAPSGREMNLQLAYSRKLSDSMDVTTYTLMRDEPGHNAKADRDYGVGMRFKVSF